MGAKKTRIAVLLLSAALLTGCAQPGGQANQGGATPTPDCQTVADALMTSQTFAEMTQLSSEKMAELLALDPASLADGVMRMDVSRATAECMVALIAASDEALKSLEEALLAYRDNTLALYRDYQPGEVPKLEGAVLRTQGLQTVLVVCAESGKAQRALDDIWK